MQLCHHNIGGDPTLPIFISFVWGKKKKKLKILFSLVALNKIKKKKQHREMTNNSHQLLSIKSLSEANKYEQMGNFR